MVANLFQKMLSVFCVIILPVIITPVISADFDGGTELSQAKRDEGFVLSQVKNELDSEVIIRIEVPDIKFSQKTVDGENYTVLEIAEAGWMMTPGEPLLPMIGHFFQISDTLAPHVSLNVIRSHQIPLEYPILPAQEDLEPSDVYTIESKQWYVYSENNWFPSTHVLQEDPVILRDVRLLPVAYYPIRYNGGSQTLEIIDEAELVIKMVDEPTVNILESHGPYSPSFEQLYRALVPNYDDSWSENRDRNTAERYLLIMKDMFESRCQGFIAWKEQQGFVVDIMRFSELGGNPSYTTVYNAILAKYQGEERPTYVSIIGSTNHFPVHESHDSYMSGYFDDDLYYSQLEGSDLLPDIYLSRYPVVDGEELTTMLNRILYYEQTPHEGTDLYKTALMACSGLYSSQQTTKEQTADRLTINLNYTNIHTMYNWTSSSVNQVQSWINEGVSLINYRGEGWQSGWHPEHAYNFEYPEVYALQNGDQFPVVTSIGCGVAMFDASHECFAHAWVTLGDSVNMRGAVAFMGPTWNTRTTINNWIDRGIYRGFCYHDLTRSAQAFVYGKLYSYSHFLGTPYMTNDIPTHMREYILFGNPDLFWRTSVPRHAQVYQAWCPSSDRVGALVLDNSGHKVPNAQICFIKDTEQRVYVTDGGGGCRLYMNDITEPVPYTLTGWNLLPNFETFDLTEIGEDGNIIITEIKPDIETTGFAGDKIELANLDTTDSVNLKNWTIGDLDGYDLPFVTQDAILGPHQLAVVELVGFNGVETVTETSYGLLIKSRAVVGLSSLEDTAVIRNARGRVRDAVCWHNGSGIGSTNESFDLSKLTQPESSLKMGSNGWWTGPDTVEQNQYESLTIDWSDYAGIGGPGSIQRTAVPGTGEYDSPANFVINSNDNFGSWTFPISNKLLTSE